MEVMLPTDIQILQTALYHPLGGIAIAHYHAFGERTMIDTYTNGTT